MKLILVMMTALLVHVQANVMGQRISLNEKKASLQKVMDKISKQTGYDFLVLDYRLIADVKDITIQVQKKPLKEALDQLLGTRNLRYSIEDNSIVIREGAIAPVVQESPIKLSDLQEYSLQGAIVSLIDGKPIAGVSVAIADEKGRASTKSDGSFSVPVTTSAGTVKFSHVGYKPLALPYSVGVSLIVKLIPLENQLEEVEVVSTGYQKIPKERATGSFELIDNKLLNQRISTDFLDRLENASVSTTFSKDNEWADRSYYSNTAPRFDIRGRSVVSGNGQPTIVVDNVVYEGDIRNINPNDIENISILKDAVASSIWGTKAGSGVIVITTKKGSYNQKAKWDFSTNITVADRPNLFALPQMSNSDFIELETFLFDKGYYNSALKNRTSYPTISPIVDLLDSLRNGTLTYDYVQNKVALLKTYDLRKDYEKYVYRNAVNQQASLNVSGGGKDLNYIVSVGTDNNSNQLVTSKYKRNTLRTALNFKPTDRMEVSTDFSYTNALAKNNSVNSPMAYGTENAGSGSLSWPYQRLVDAKGNPIAVDYVPYRASFRDTAGNGYLQNWEYIPLAELDQSANNTKVQDVLINVAINYKLAKGIAGTVAYSYQNSRQDIEDWTGLGAFFTRNSINSVTQWNDKGVISTPIPVGDMLFNGFKRSVSNMGRIILQYDRPWFSNPDFNVSGLLGAEIKQIRTDENGAKLFGFNRDNYSYQRVNYNVTMPLLNRKTGGIQLEDNVVLDALTNRYISVYGNINLSYKNRYIITGSARQDASNLFGVRANNRWSPLWSAGISWLLHEENFMQDLAIPLLKLRATYGFSGRAQTSYSPLPIIYYQGNDYLTGYPYADITSPSNQNLGWERIKTINLAADIGLFNNRLNATFEWYRKHSMDLISSTPLDPSTGYETMVMNGGYLLAKGFDIQIRTANIQNLSFRWNTSLLLNKNRNVVKEYHYIWPRASDYVLNSGSAGSNFLKGYDVGAVFAYGSKGLDSEGDPVGYLNGEESKDYLNIRLQSTKDDLRYFGTGIPVWNGSLRNEFSFGRFSLSFNIQTRLGFYFFRSSFNQQSFAQRRYGHKDYAERWQNPGDELFTNVPAIRYPINSYREDFYNKSEVLVVKGDNIRLQDATINYTFKKVPYFSQLAIMGYAKNLNLILWRANKFGIDPEYRDAVPYPMSFSLGVRGSF
ncbi:SusC/RagA family TonB-linked outer membrane protein [Sphingobacterium yanglingense]|nr:SusC/RagA family TonB-linked outer membrane protein [Sphingobacterium yanglingense]